MSATELINELKRISIKAEHKELGHIRYITSEAAEMLRQQQAEIEALKEEIVILERDLDNWEDKYK